MPRVQRARIRHFASNLLPLHQPGCPPTQAELEEAYAAHKLYTLWVKARRVYVAGANSGKYSCALDGGLAVTRYND